MAKLPALSSSKVIAALGKAGFEYAPKRGKGSHIALVKVTESQIPCSHTKEKIIPKGTLLSIIKQSGLTRDEFIAYL